MSTHRRRRRLPERVCRVSLHGRLRQYLGRSRQTRAVRLNDSKVNEGQKVICPTQVRIRRVCRQPPRCKYRRIRQKAEGRDRPFWDRVGRGLDAQRKDLFARSARPSPRYCAVPGSHPASCRGAMPSLQRTLARPRPRSGYFSLVVLRALRQATTGIIKGHAAGRRRSRLLRAGGACVMNHTVKRDSMHPGRIL